MEVRSQEVEVETESQIREGECQNIEVYGEIQVDSQRDALEMQPSATAYVKRQIVQLEEIKVD